MSRRRFVQLLAGFADGDAISNESRSLHGYVQQLGYEAEIYVADGRIAPTMESQCQPLSAYSPAPDDVSASLRGELAGDGAVFGSEWAQDSAVSQHHASGVLSGLR